MKTQTKFKETEIGMIPENWEVVRFKEILGEKGYIRGPFGSALRRPELKTEGIAVYEQEHAIYNSRHFRYYIDGEKFEELCRFQVKENDLVLSCSGTLGKASIISKDDPKGIISQALLILRSNAKRIRPLFLKYFIDSPRGFESLVSRSTGSVQVNIAKREIIEEIPLALPGLKEQDAIVKFISDLDSKIELNRQMNKTFENIGQALFKHWFVDFEFGNEKGKPYKSSGGEMVDSELGDIPKGWEIKPLGDVASFLRGFSYSGTEKFSTQNGYVFITLNNVKEGGGFKPVYAWIKSDRLKEHHFLKEKDLIITNTEQTKDGRLLAFPAIVHFPLDYGEEVGVFSHHITRVVPKDTNSKHFLYFFLLMTQNESVAFHTGSVIWGLDVNNFANHRHVVWPPTDIMIKFEEMAETLFEKMILNQKEISRLSSIRDSLLPRLMSGQIRVPVG